MARVRLSFIFLLLLLVFFAYVSKNQDKERSGTSRRKER